MRPQDTAKLDTHALVTRFEASGLKQLALADEVGVHRKTVSRWLSGKVKRIERFNADALAQVLGCPVDEILATRADVYATANEQARAATLVRERELVELLSPTGDWELAERLIKATLRPEATLSDLGRLYNLLSLTAWRQDHLDEAREHAVEALTIGQRTDDAALRAKARFHLGTVAWIAEDHAGAEAHYDAALAEGAFDTPRDHGSALFNLGLMTRALADFDRSFTLQRQAVGIDESSDLPFNLAIAWVGLGLTHLDIGDWAAAVEAFERSGVEANRCRFERGIHGALVYTAEARALAGDPDLDAIAAPMAALDALGSFDWRVLEAAARVARLAGDLDGARVLVDRALDAWPDPSFGYATALQERARLGGGVADWQAANARFAAVGLVGRIDRGDVREPGTLFGRRGAR